MMSYYKLVEMNNNGVEISITNQTYSDNNTGGQKWRARATKNADGVSLSIDHTDVDLDTCIDDIHAKWMRATGHGMPEHKLNILEHYKQEEAFTSCGTRIDDDEIPF